MNERVKEIEKDIQPQNYLNSFKAMEHLKYLLSHISTQKKKIEELEERIKECREESAIEFIRVVEKKRELDNINTKLREALDNALNDYSKAEAKVKQLEEGLKEIAEGKGRYDMDHLKHAENTIEDMKEIAIGLLDKK